MIVTIRGVTTELKKEIKQNYKLEVINMKVKDFINTFEVVDNAVFVDNKTGEQLFQIIRNSDRITLDMIPANILDMEVKVLCGASAKHKIAIYVK